MKFNKQILEAINRGIQLALDDFDFNDNIESKPTNDIINVNNQAIAQAYVRQINNIQVNNTINIDSDIKRQIRKLYKLLRINLAGEKYIVTSREELKHLIKHIVILNPKANLNWIDTSHITNMVYLFDDFFLKEFCGNISKWNMSNVTNARNMFYGCRKFNCDISKWDVHNLRLMGNMFGECYKFNQDLSNWDVSNVTEMSCTFAGCHNFNCDLSNWDVSNVTDMAYMFSRCDKFNQDLSKWDVSNVTRNNGFYYKAKFALTPEWVPNFDLNKTLGNP